MESASDFVIILDHFSRPYFPGETLTGKVVLTNSQEKEIERIDVYFVGKASVKYNTGLESAKFSSQRMYINKNITLVENITIPSGRHELPFSYKLPADLPSTFVLNAEKYGEVFYYAEAVLKQSKKVLSVIAGTSRCYFNVHALVDLNADASLKNPLTVYKTFYFNKNKVNCTLDMTKTGLEPGELLLFTITIDNQDSRKIKHVIFNLLQRSTFIANVTPHFSAENKKHTKYLASSVSGPSIEAEKRLSWLVDSLRIPGNIPTTQNDKSHLILVNYELQIILKASNSLLSDKAKFAVPIVIGTVPIWEKNEGNEVNLPRVRTQSRRESASLHFDMAPPPSYEEAIAAGAGNGQST